MQKHYMTIDEQINFLKTEKKLNFKSEKLAKRVLQEVGYYKLINVYKIPFVIYNGTNNQYLDNVFFEDIYSLYKFDTDTCDSGIGRLSGGAISCV